jgi:hypothetical protein
VEEAWSCETANRVARQDQDFKDMDRGTHAIASREGMLNILPQVPWNIQILILLTMSGAFLDVIKEDDGVYLVKQIVPHRHPPSL